MSESAAKSLAERIAQRAEGCRPNVVRIHFVPEWVFDIFTHYRVVMVLFALLLASLITNFRLYPYAKAGRSLCDMPLAGLVSTECVGCTRVEAITSDMQLINYDYQRALACPSTLSPPPEE